MKTSCAMIAATVAALTLDGALAPALGRPPTVQNSPGYDVRLAESRKAWAAWQAAQPTQPTPVTPVRHPRKKISGTSQ
jgi:hypothetical protein